ncbi:MAG: trehalase family glycosidase [Verrucomicrobiota bacterium]
MPHLAPITTSPASISRIVPPLVADVLCGSPAEVLPRVVMLGDASASLTDQQARLELLGHLERLRPVVIKPANNFIKHPYCIPGGFYDQQWDWDGFFIASHLAARTPPQPEYLKFWTLNVLASILPDGDVAACITPAGPRLGERSLRLKPFIAQGAELAARLLDDYGWVDEHYEEIARIATRRETTHFVEAYGLFVWEDAMQSGADNNPAIGNDESALKTVMACDVNAFVYREYLALASLADRLGRGDDQVRYAAKALALREALNTHLWDAEAESYWNRHASSGQWLKRVSYSNFVPLWAEMVPPERAQTMIRRYLWNDQHMLASCGLRSLSRQDPDYNNANTIIPFSNWQGPVWPIANYFYFVALLQHGFRQEAEELVRRLTRLYLRDIAFCGSLHENYCAETGAPLAPSAAQSKHGLEGGFVGWNLLLQDMIEMLDGRPHLLTLQF